MKSTILTLTLFHVFNTPILAMEKQLVRSEVSGSYIESARDIEKKISSEKKVKKKKSSFSMIYCLLLLIVAAQSLIIGFGYKGYLMADKAVSGIQNKLSTCETRLDQAEAAIRNITAQTVIDCNNDAQSAVQDCQEDSQEVSRSCDSVAQMAVAVCNQSAESAIETCKAICGND